VPITHNMTKSTSSPGIISTYEYGAIGDQTYGNPTAITIKNSSDGSTIKTTFEYRVIITYTHDYNTGTLLTTNGVSTNQGTPLSITNSYTYVND